MEQIVRERLASLLPRIQRLRVPLIIGLLLLIPYSVLGFAYIRAAPQQSSLRDQIARLSAITTGAQSRAKDVEAEFLAIQKGVPPATLMEIDVFRAMQEQASQTGLDPAKLTIELKGAPLIKKVGNTQYRQMSFAMTVSGDYENLWALIQKLDRGQTNFKTLVLTKTSITLGAGPSNAALEFTIYTAAQ